MSAVAIGSRVFLNADARLWMPDINVRPGTVVEMSSGVPLIQWWGIEERSWVNARNLETS